MSRSYSVCCLILILIVPIASHGAHPPRLAEGTGTVIHGAVLGADKNAVADTILLMGPWSSSAPYNGQFEDPDGTPHLLNDQYNPHTWTSRDLTARDEAIWHVDTYHAVSGVYSVWCGEIGYPACVGIDPEGGYGNSYDERLDWTATVPNPELPTTLQVAALLNHDTEPGYDYVYLSYYKKNQPENFLWIRDGAGEAVVVNETVVYITQDYLGDAGDEVLLQWHVTSDGAWSDEDCLYYGAGACQIDDITVTMTHGGIVTTTFDDFEDGYLGLNWEVTFPGSVGDFAQIWTDLEDIDPCSSNYSAQVAFVDDGLIVPGTDGTYCINWCYGPAGYIVNHDGGLLGAGHELRNAVESPVMAYPDGDFGHAQLAFDVYHHNPLDWDSPAMLFQWAIRSSSVSSEDLLLQPWEDRNFLYMDTDGYRRFDLPVGDLLVPGRDFVQIQLTCYQLQVWDWGVRDDGTPTPYFDNVRLGVAHYSGPALSAFEGDLANDGFPACGTIDLSDPGALSVRFDMAANISQPEHLRIDPGDSIVTSIVAVRAGSFIEDGSVRLVYAMNPNTMFDPYRNSGLPYSGSVSGWSVGSDLWAFDLPDSGFLFPGDVMHYYIEAADNAGGDIRTSTLPADLTGFGQIVDPPVYDARFTVRALPDLDESGTAKQILIWIDGGDPAPWHEIMATFHLDDPFPYDLFTTRAPDSDLGNGLGARATVAQLAGYKSIVYTAGDLGHSTLCNGDYQNDPSDDLNLLDVWLQLEDKGLFVCGDNLVKDLALNAGTLGINFLAYQMGVASVDSDVRPLINNQTAPLVDADGFYPSSWIAQGGCPGINTFDAVHSLLPAERLAEFTDPSQYSDIYSYSALTRNVMQAINSVVISTPYDLLAVAGDPQNAHCPTDLEARQALLHTILELFDVRFPQPPDGVPGAGVRFTVAHAPNPFNPTVRIAYTLPKDDHLKVKVYNLRGALVRTLHDEQTVAGPGVVIWDGTDDRGEGVASGVYFYAAKTSSEEKIGKVTLIK